MCHFLYPNKNVMPKLFGQLNGRDVVWRNKIYFCEQAMMDTNLVFLNIFLCATHQIQDNPAICSHSSFQIIIFINCTGNDGATEHSFVRDSFHIINMQAIRHCQHYMFMFILLQEFC